MNRLLFEDMRRCQPPQKEIQIAGCGARAALRPPGMLSSHASGTWSIDFGEHSEA